MPQIIPIKEFKNTNGISEMCNKTDKPIFVTKNGYGDLVIMSMKTYEERMAKLELYEQLSISEAQFEKGDTLDARKALSDIKEKQ
ncbi:MAG: type II toxin-antitoxin system Phd/YefM family antitoxin [Erysipelotrichaceae bacterium]|nr:type II toxin-antitoxin system Phd/YefM family antitoxin [Erysipelotrichaceae bacterium]